MNCHHFRHVFLLFLVYLLAAHRLFADSVDDCIRDLTVILFTNNQGFDPYRLTLDVMRFFVPAIGRRHD